LEHILECHFEPFFRRTAELIKQGNAQFADTFLGCWKLGQAKEGANSTKFDRLGNKARRLLRQANLEPELSAAQPGAAPTDRRAVAPGFSPGLKRRTRLQAFIYFARRSFSSRR
jgi:hypothetical protein